MLKLKANAALLSNYEVYTLLKDFQEEKKLSRNVKHSQNLATISYETLRYLEQTPCTHLNEEAIHKFLMEIQPYNLTKAEKLQLINHRPTALVEIQLLIEESEERLTEENMEEILAIVARVLPANETTTEATPMEADEEELEAGTD
ncbi:RNA polymerase III subunit I isoform X3 [Tachypleus tridentatus]|uniref:RNA polymerase III subunit I isoform X3 n=1 Tax=Tachypleus tridentatus TaxID=6853 RepID=UPI003FD21B71